MSTMQATAQASAILHYSESLNLRHSPSPNVYTYPVPLSPYDSDLEVLLPHTVRTNPQPEIPSSLQYLGGSMYIPPSIPRPPPTDDDIIPAIIIDVIPSPKTVHEKEKKGLRLGLVKRVIGGGNAEKKKEEKGTLKVVYMPRKEYAKYFARGMRGEYCGTEPHRRWREEELEREFGRYKPPERMWRRRGWGV